MDYYSSEERSTPDSCSTSDMGCIGDSNPSVSKTTPKNLRGKQKKIIKDIFARLKSQFCHLLDDPFELKYMINQEFLNNSWETLVEKFGFQCCKTEQHSLYCEKIWHRVREDLLDLVDEELKSTRDVFVIRKKQSSKLRFLLDRSQPSWIHKIMVQNIFNSNN